MRSHAFAITFFAITGLVFTGAGFAQVVDAQGKRIDAFMVDEPPVLDGVLDDDAWAFGAVISDLYQVTPEEFSPPSEDSQVYVVYTKDALYVGARFYDREPDKVGALVLRQGDFSWGEDTITVMVDPLNQGSQRLRVRSHGPTASETRRSTRMSPGRTGRGRESGTARRGWMSMAGSQRSRFPLRRCPSIPSNDVWGLNVGRYIGRKTEQIGWTSRNRDMNPSVFGEMTGMSGAEKGIGLDVVPSARVSQAKDFGADVSTDSVEPAIDVFYKITSSLTASLTVNTDFSGTSADARQINLTRFGLFFPEQRIFFLQDTDIFEFGQIGGQSFEDRSTISRVERESGRPFLLAANWPEWRGRNHPDRLRWQDHRPGRRLGDRCAGHSPGAVSDAGCE